MKFNAVTVQRTLANMMITMVSIRAGSSPASALQTVSDLYAWPEVRYPKDTAKC
jgi:hypothetical protein